jgi:hypothetical protein
MTFGIIITWYFTTNTLSHLFLSIFEAVALILKASLERGIYDVSYVT